MTSDLTGQEQPPSSFKRQQFGCSQACFGRDGRVERAVSVCVCVCVCVCVNKCNSGF